MIQLLASVAFVTFWNMNGMPQKLHLNFKPFNCAPCLGFWVALGLMWAPTELLEIMAITFGAGVIAPVAGMVLITIYEKIS